MKVFPADAVMHRRDRQARSLAFYRVRTFDWSGHNSPVWGQG